MIEPKVGDYVKPDGWLSGDRLEEDDGYRDGEFPGCQFRLGRDPYEVAVNVKVTGRVFHEGWYGKKIRVRVEFVGDGEPSTFSGGWLFPKEV